MNGNEQITGIEWREMPPETRISSCIPGDPVSDYYGFPEIQRAILADEAAEKAKQLAGAAGSLTVEQVQQQ